MAPSYLKSMQNKQNKSTWKSQLKKFANPDEIKKFITDPHYITPVCIILFLIEAVLNAFIIEKVKYTEIDWIAYMQEVEGFLNGTLEYKELKGRYFLRQELTYY